MLFGRKKKQSQNGMPLEVLMKFDKCPIKYVTERDSENFREKKLGDEGALNVMNGEFVIVCGGKNVMRCDIKEVRAAELMNLSGITVKGFDLDENREKSVIAYYSDGYVSAARAKQR